MTVRGDRQKRALIRLMAGANSGASEGLAKMTSRSTMSPSLSSMTGTYIARARRAFYGGEELGHLGGQAPASRECRDSTLRGFQDWGWRLARSSRIPSPVNLRPSGESLREVLRSAANTRVGRDDRHPLNVPAPANHAAERNQSVLVIDTGP